MDEHWKKGTPDQAGYYLVAFRTNINRVIVSELWYNQDAIYPWWTTRGYLNQLRRGGINDAMRSEVIAWMPLPTPPED